jgi:hypothetical protein
MRQQDERRMDYIPHLRARTDYTSTVKRFNDSVSTNFPSYGVGY